MDVIAQDHRTAALWRGLLASVQREMEARGAHPSRTVVLVPYAQLMPLGKRMWAQFHPDGFAPRFETTMNWAGQFGHLPGADDISFDRGRDLLTARAWLDRSGLGRHAGVLASRLLDAAWQLGGVAATLLPATRPDWAARAAPALAADAGALQIESAVARIALAWAAASSYAGDTLFDPEALQSLDLLVAVSGLQADPMAQALAALMGEKAVTLSLDTAEASAMVRLHVASDPADEAERAAACVIAHLEFGLVPVALPAVDRVLTRRIRAMLEARNLAVRDETGWKLSTTRSAAGVMASLRACAWNATTDAVIDWLKNSPSVPPFTVDALERRARRQGWRDWRNVAAGRLGEGSVPDLVAQVQAWRESMAEARALRDWLVALQRLLHECGQWSALVRDAAGMQLVAALGLDRIDAADWLRTPQATRALSATEFTAWVDEVLEGSTFRPPNPTSEQVVILPFHQLLGRPFPALVLAGCDEQRLPAAPEPVGAWTASQRAALGLPLREALVAEAQAGWRSALQIGQVDVLWRRSDDSGEPVLPSPLVQSLQLAGGGFEGADARQPRPLSAQPVPRPQAAGTLLPIDTLSASAYEDLRRCPYRFFALRQLGLRESDEIESELDKRDFGNWLHQVLRLFHEGQRDHWEPPGPGRLARLEAAAEEAKRTMGLQRDEFLPFASAWPQARDGYLEWLARYEGREGATFVQAESEHERQLGPVRLVGRIDRIDRLGDGRAVVMDYKTEPGAATRDRVRNAAEDTQLAFYAALLDDDHLRATYVNIGERGKTEAYEQPDVQPARAMLEAGILQDIARVAAGDTLGALGEGTVCDYCDARGLCRRDFWS
jgi:ATP-dependent helicase/nuclease subunit B